MTAGAEPSVLPKGQKGGRPCTGTGAAEEGAQQAYGEPAIEWDDIQQILTSIRPQPLSCALGKPKDQSYEIGGEGMFPLSPRVLHSWFPCIYII